MPTLQKNHRGGGILVLTLDKPPANAIDEALLRELCKALAEAEGDARVRAVVLAGDGPFFSAGFDFSTPRRDDEVALELYGLYRDAHLALLGLPKPTVAMVGGHAVAGGFVLALACDHRVIADAGQSIGMNEVAVGASFPRAAMEIVRLRLTSAAAAETVLGAKLYPATEAVRLGFAERFVDRSSLEAEACALARALAAHPCEAYAHAKEALIADAVRSIRDETDAEALATMSVWITEESRAARRRQREKLGAR